MSKQNRNPGSQRQQPQQGAGSRQMEQQEGETPRGDDPDFRAKPGGMQHEQQGGAGAQPGSTGIGDAEARRGDRQTRQNRDRDRGDPENR